MRSIAFAIDALLNADLASVSGPAHTRFAAAYASTECVRKIEPLDSSEIDSLTFDGFLASNERCRQYVTPDDPASSYLLELARSKLARIFDDPDHSFFLETVIQGIDLGPGSNVGGHPSANYALKIAHGLTGRENLLRLYDSACCLTPYQLFAGSGRRTVDGSNISFVPKSYSSSRMICTEPTVNMLFQKGVSRIIESALLRLGIDLRVQPDRNGELARRGSIDGSLSTIDLSAASDSISLGLFRDIAPARLLHWALATRSEYAYYGDSKYELFMVSTMGNGYTFSLQTLIFYVLASVACEDEKVDVFGDDIIIPSRFVPRFLSFLNALGFTPNAKKTFAAGPFRESCGQDFYSGHNVRPHYIKRLETTQDLCVHINRIRDWSVKTGLALPLTEAYFCSLIADYKLPFVPPFETDDAGIRARSIRPLCAKRIDVRSGPKYSHHTVYGYYYYKYMVSPKSLIFNGAGFHGAFADEFNRLLHLQPDLLNSLFLRGNIRENSVSFRTSKPRYRLVRVFSTTPW